MKHKRTGTSVPTIRVWRGRYILRKRLGAGVSSEVWLAHDERTGQEVALKHFEEWHGNGHQSRKEISNLTFLSQLDVNGKYITKLRDVFHQYGRPCLVLDYVPGITLEQAIKGSQKQGLALAVIRRVTSCLLRTLQFLASRTVDMVHGDLKPENVMLLEEHRCAMLIDYGLATLTGEMRKNMYIQSRWYRSPEVILCLQASPQADMWSLGCLMIEMFTGVPFFQGRDSRDQMRQIVETIGMPPKTMIDSCESNTRDALHELQAEQTAKVDQVEDKTDLFKRRLIKSRNRCFNDTELETFVDLICRLLVNDPQQRITAASALLHPFLIEPAGCSLRKVERQLASSAQAQTAHFHPSASTAEYRPQTTDILSSDMSSLRLATPAARRPTPTASTGRDAINPPPKAADCMERRKQLLAHLRSLAAGRAQVGAKA